MSKESITHSRIWWAAMEGAFKFQNNNFINKLNCNKNNADFVTYLVLKMKYLHNYS